MSDGLIETDKDFLTKPQKFTSFVDSCSTSEEYKILDTVVPDELLGVNTIAGSYQIEEYKSSSLVVILHCLNSFQHCDCVAFSLFLCTT